MKPLSIEVNEIGVIGVGKMGLSIIRSLRKLRRDTNLVLHTYDIDPEKSEALTNFTSMEIHDSVSGIVNADYPVIICTKPNEIADIVSKIPNERLIISVAAGITIPYIDTLRQKKGPTIRVMPNIAFQVKKGFSVLCANSLSSPSDKDLATQFFQQGGKVKFVENENIMDAITALSGSGPAYVFSFIQALEDAAVLLGLSREFSREIAIETVLGGATLCNHKPNISPQDLIHQVTSPAGTTIHGITALKKYRFDTSIFEAVKAAYQQSKNISSQNK